MGTQKLTKAEIIENIQQKYDNLNKPDIHKIIDEFFEEVKSGLEQDRVIELRGFGTFEVRTRKGREKARNPKTGDLVAVDTHGVAIFRPGKELKDFVWNLRQEKN
ncbi:MAG: HU family DNA-binding protein [Sphaerochaetaceae bacterium]|jgi:integration host factor subunit beta|nr:HU family DNA-binding protein [Sphaerochaetaceae bacterium]NLV83072.1 integration host factor subunit beta [Spirochaetales bacterium]